MFKEPKAMREIHKIQEDLYKEEKGLSRDQLIKKTREEARKFKEKFGLKSKTHAVTGSQ